MTALQGPCPGGLSGPSPAALTSDLVNPPQFVPGGRGLRLIGRATDAGPSAGHVPPAPVAGRDTEMASPIMREDLVSGPGSPVHIHLGFGIIARPDATVPSGAVPSMPTALCTSKPPVIYAVSDHKSYTQKNLMIKCCLLCEYSVAGNCPKRVIGNN